MSKSRHQSFLFLPNFTWFLYSVLKNMLKKMLNHNSSWFPSNFNILVTSKPSQFSYANIKQLGCVQFPNLKLIDESFHSLHMYSTKFAHILPYTQMKCEIRDFRRGMTLYLLNFLSKTFITQYLNWKRRFSCFFCKYNFSLSDFSTFWSTFQKNSAIQLMW